MTSRQINSTFGRSCLQYYRQKEMADGDGTPKTIHEVFTPCFLVNIDTVKRNAQRMYDACKELGLQLRPHTKTHKCLEIGEISTLGTKRSIVVSTLAEAEFFADAGYDDIVFGTIFSYEKISRLKKLGQRLESFHLFIDRFESLKFLEENPLENKSWSLLIKVDCGSGRAGVLWDDDESVELAKRISESSKCTLRGLYCHEGQSYHSRGTDEIQETGSLVAEHILNLASRIKEAGVVCKSIGIGSTPTASRPTAAMKGLTELHPGNYLFYDAQQNVIGSCALEDIAVRLATRVIGHYPHRNQLLVDCGFTALSHDGHGALANGSYCLIDDQPNLRLIKMTQEVGFIEPRKGKLKYEDYPIGKLLLLIPYHSCATACMHSRYLVHSGDTIVDTWIPCRGW